MASLALAQPQPANVYRDPLGVPHIEAQTETAAWYALGYEEARDALLLLQVSAKRVRGQSVKYLSDKAGVLTASDITLKNRMFTDMLVEILGTYPQHHSEAELRTMFASPQVAGENFYDNCVAFAAGVNDYRLLVANATTPGSPEYDLKQWLSNAPLGTSYVDLSWVYLEPVTALDFLWYGRWLNAFFATNFALSKLARVNSIAASYADSAFTELSEDGTAVEETVSWSESELITAPTATDGLQRMEELKKMFAGFPGMGSNSFCWTKEYCKEGQTEYSGLMADPHDGNFSSNRKDAGSFLRDVFLGEPQGVHTWFAHVRVTPPGATAPSLDVFGTIPHGMATFFTAHNQNLAWGGTLGAPNWADSFLLRMEEHPTNGTNLSYSYYDYYRDADGSNGAQPSDWSTIAPLSCRILRHGVPDTVLTYWRAGPFGFVLPDLDLATAYMKNPVGLPPPLPVVYGEWSNTSPSYWRTTAGNTKMRFWNEPHVATRDPMVCTVRVPLDAAVDGEKFHWMFPRDAWVFAHLGSVADVQLRLMENAASYFVNFCCVDRAGAVLATQLGAVPERLHRTAGSSGPIVYGGTPLHVFDAYLLYSGGIGPVPARMREDQVFDWRYNNYGSTGHPVPGSVTPGSLRYLSIAGSVANHNLRARFDYHGPGASFPGATEAQNTSVPGWWTDNAGFAAMCNATPWHASRKWSYVGPGVAGNFNNLTVDNPVYMAVLDAGTLYQVAVYLEESPDRNQMVIDRLTKIARSHSTSPTVQAAAQPPMTIGEAKQFVVDPKLYVAEEYNGNNGPVAVAALPPAIRQLEEVMSNLGTPGTSGASNGWPNNEADREARFFHDLWDVLTNPSHPAYQYWHTFRAPGQPANLSLKQIWVDNLHQELSLNPPVDVRHVMWYDDPTGQVLPNYGLKWLEMPQGFALIDFQWDESQLGAGNKVAFHGSGTGGFDGLAAEGQALLSHLTGWGGATPKYVMAPDSSAAALYELWKMSYFSLRTWLPLVDGTPQTAAFGVPWGYLRGTAFPYSQMVSGNMTDAPIGIPPEAYQALYYDVASWAVRDTQSHAITVDGINAITKLFLSLGGFFVGDAGTTNNGNPSRKMARYRLIEARVAAAGGNLRAKMLESYPGSYPLTANLVRMTVPRKLIEAGVYMGGSAVVPSRRMDHYFRTRLCDHHGQVVWPLVPGGVGATISCKGGQLCDVTWWPDERVQSGNPFVRVGASNHPLLTLFPSSTPAQPPRSYFWASPGIRLMVPGDPSFSVFCDSVANGELVESYFPVSSYQLPQYFVATRIYVK